MAVLRTAGAPLASRGSGHSATAGRKYPSLPGMRFGRQSERHFFKVRSNNLVTNLRSIRLPLAANFHSSSTKALLKLA